MVERGGIVRDHTVAAGCRRSGKDQTQAGRTIFQILQCLHVRSGRVGVVEALHQGPGRARRAPGNRFCPRRASIERFDPQAVVSMGHQPLVESGTLERGVDQLAPLRLGRPREFGGERKIVSHVGKMAQSARSDHISAARCG